MYFTCSYLPLILIEKARKRRLHPHAEFLLSGHRGHRPVHVRPQRHGPVERRPAGGVPPGLAGPDPAGPEPDGAAGPGGSIPGAGVPGAVPDLLPEPAQAAGGERQIPELVAAHQEPLRRRPAAPSGQGAQIFRLQELQDHLPRPRGQGQGGDHLPQVRGEDHREELIL